MFILKNKTILSYKKRKLISNRLKRTNNRRKALLLTESKHKWNPFKVNQFYNNRKSSLSLIGVCLLSGRSNSSNIKSFLNKRFFKLLCLQGALPGFKKSNQ
jgi:hypothetical protein